MNENTLKNYNRWLNSEKVSLEDKEYLKKLNENQIDDSFFTNIKFGTAGMRGKLGPGTNRMNNFVVKKATIGFGLYLKELYAKKGNISVAISHDNRHFSREFTILSANILNDMGIDAYIFDSLRPTPELSYAVRYQKCNGGIMITASHNPKEDNGYKVYDETGCQLVPYQIKRLIEIIDSLGDELEIEVPLAKSKGKTYTFDSKIDDDYVKEVESIQINKDLNKKGFKIVYTPNHGTSYVNAMRVFKDCGYEIYPVLSQCNPDPDFSGTLSPNPEDPRSFIEPIKLAKEIDADLICMTDPDGDRVGLACKGDDNEYHLLTGNESAAILLDYILSQKSEKGEMPSNPVMYSTVVTSNLGKAIATYYGVKTELFLTGFKYIGERIHHYETKGSGPTFVFGYEESYGCLIKPFVRDKDGIQAILMYAEMALFYKLQGINLVQAYNNLGKRFGYYKTKLYSIYFNGSEGAQKMQSIMDEVENNPFTQLLDKNVEIFEDYFKLKRINLKTKTEEDIPDLPKGDLVKFIFEDGSNVCVRPSGTEPKCKFYIEIVSNTLDGIENLPNKYYEEIKRIYKIEE